MNELRFYQKPWFYTISWSLIWGGIYIWQVHSLGGLIANLPYIFLDAILFTIGLLVWLAFFAQFVLPVRSLRERQQIFNRLLTYLTGRHGPAIFIRDGKQVRGKGEEKKNGPGVLWLDSASAAVTRTATSFKQIIGPGVHFTDRGEFIASTVDLHLQSHRIGPWEEEDVFASKPGEDAGETERDKYEQTQKRRLEVSAWTRDGIEVVPNISVTFQIDAIPSQGDEEGSRFGFDKESVRKAITGEGINPGASSDAVHRRIAWNQLPARIAANLWREYLSKFTLAELFNDNRTIPIKKPGEQKPQPHDTQALYQPIAPGNRFELILADILYGINVILTGWADKCEFSQQKTIGVTSLAESGEGAAKETPKTETALGTINRMVEARMTDPEVDLLSDSGWHENGTVHSREFDLLQSRGLKVKSVSINNLRFPPDIEDQLVRQWNATWLENAKAEQERIEHQRSLVKMSAQIEAVLKYAQSLSGNLLKKNPGRSDPAETLKTMLLQSRDELIKNDRFHRRASMEQEALEELIQWVKRNSI